MIERGEDVWSPGGRRASYAGPMGDGRHVVFPYHARDPETGEEMESETPEIWPVVLTERPKRIEHPDEPAARARLDDLRRQIVEAQAQLAEARDEIRYIKEARKRDAGIDEIIRWRDGELPIFAEASGRFRIMPAAPDLLVEATFGRRDRYTRPEWRFRAKPNDDYGIVPGGVFATEADALAWIGSEVAPKLSDYEVARLVETHPGLALDPAQRERARAYRIKAARESAARHRAEVARAKKAADEAEQALRALEGQP